jgi:hypothetical protein
MMSIHWLQLLTRIFACETSLSSGAFMSAPSHDAVLKTVSFAECLCDPS